MLTKTPQKAANKYLAKLKTSKFAHFLPNESRLHKLQQAEVRLHKKNIKINTFRISKQLGYESKVKFENLSIS